MTGRSGIAAACLVLAASLLPDAARAIGTHTPLAWQQLVGPPADSVFEGQRKNTTWIRDANRNFVDDLIDNAQAETVDVILDFNRPLTFREIQSRFGPFGRIQYVSRVLTAAFLKDVRVSRVDSLARSPLVAMVEWQPPIRLSVVYSTREIQARANTSYPTYSSSAESPRGQTGVGVGIAILDTGVDEGHLSIPDATHGFDALNFEDANANGADDSSEPSPVGDGPDSSDELGEGDSNPEPCATSGGVTTCQMHGTYVAGVALGRGYDDKTDQCAGPTTPDDEDGLAVNCAGTASGADLVDVRVCPGDTGDCEFTDVTEGLEWLALKGAEVGVRVANLSFVVCADDDPTGILPSLVDYVAASGVVVVAGHGNQDRCTTANPSCDSTRPNRRTLAPGAAPLALTVSATNDQNTIDRDDDSAYSAGLEGPRCPTVAGTALGRADLKPDLSAPGEGIWTAKAGTTSGYEPMDGTSLAAPHVAGAAAILLGAQPEMDPASTCDLLMRTADPPTASTPYDTALDPVWSEFFGMGIVNVDAALGSMDQGDVAFPSCFADPGKPGSPCRLEPPRRHWENNIDIVTDIAPPVAKMANTIRATVENRGTSEAQVDVDFGVYILGTGTRAFYHVGRQRKTIAAGMKEEFAQPWTPESEGHQCAQVAIRYGPDTIFWNNVTQRNLTILPEGTIVSAPGSQPARSEAVYAATPPAGRRVETDILVENPFLAPGSFRVEATSSTPGLPCAAKPERFTNDPSKDMPQVVRVSLTVPATKSAVDSADCRVAVYGTPRGSQRESEIGGVTVRGVEPVSCEIRGYVQDTAGLGIRGVRVSYARAIRPGTTPFEKVARSATTGSSGEFRVSMEAGIPYRIRLQPKSSPPRDYVVSPACGSSPVRLVYSPEQPSTPGVR